MSAQNVADAIINEIDNEPTDFICLNFANPDMVGHTGVYKAVTDALEIVDKCTQQVVEAGLKKDYGFMIIADHGNADFMINNDGTPNTAHTTNLVPCFLLNTDYKKLKKGKLADIAPTILKIMGLEIPNEMNGNVIIQSNINIFNGLELRRKKKTNTLNRISLFLIDAKRNKNH